MKNYMKYFNLEITINNYLNDILNYTEAAYKYLTEKPEYMDKDELIMYLATVPENIETVKELIEKLEDTYEEEIRGEIHE